MECEILTLRRTPKPTRRDSIYEFVQCFAVDHCGNTPSLGEIARQFKISRNTVYSHTLKLVNDGRAKWIDGEFILVGAEYVPPVPQAPVQAVMRFADQW